MHHKDKKLRGVRVRLGDIDVIKLGTQRFSLSDPYYFVLTIHWGAFFALVVSFYLTVNLLFATLYWLGSPCIANARPGVFRDLFFFSIETFATVGYGVMSPQSLYGHIVSSVEIVFGMLSMAVITGLMFTRFSRPRARLMFSRIAVVSPHFSEHPALMLRIANQRHQVIADAQAKLTLLRSRTTATGGVMRRFVDLPLERSEAPMLALSWTLIHPIDANSPLHGMTAADMAADEMALIVSINGYDESISSPITARHTYATDAVIFGHEFVDILCELDDGRIALDLTRFHDSKPATSN